MSPRRGDLSEAHRRGLKRLGLLLGLVGCGLSLAASLRGSDRAPGLFAIAAGIGAIAIVALITIPLYNSRLRALSPLTGPGGWTATCVDPDCPQAWRSLLVDAGGVRLVTLFGTARQK